MIKKFKAFYVMCRNKGGSVNAFGETSRYRAFKFAVGMSWDNFRYRGRK